MKTACFFGIMLTLVVGCAAPSGRNAEQTTVLTANGTVIVNTPGAARAAELLQQYLRRAAGAGDGFDIVKETDAAPAPGTNLIAVGPTRWITDDLPADLSRDGYVIRRTGNVIAICGGTDRGTFHGAAGFLDRFAGVRFYMPGDLWTSLPEDKKVAVPAQVDIRDEPFVTGATLSVLWGPGAEEWAERNAGLTRTGLAGTHQHNMNNVFPVDRFKHRYPELYPIIGGERYFPDQANNDQDWNPCFTSEQTLDAAEEMALEWFEQHPDYFWFSMGLQDSHEHCGCPGCRAAFDRLEQECRDILDAGNKERLVCTYMGNPADWKDPEQKRTAGQKWARMYALSQLQWGLLNRLAERMEDKAPGKYVEALAYGITCFAPRFALRPNVMIFMQIHVSDNVRDLLDPREDGSLPLDAFIDATGAIGNHEWYRGHGYMVPRIYSGYWSKFMRHLEAKGKTVNFQHAEAYPNWGMDGPKLWVLTRTWWNPDNDPEALWRTFCGDMFGQAADQMHRYFATLEKWFMEQSWEQKPKWKIGRYDDVFRRAPEAFRIMTEARVHLDAAKGLARTTEQKERISLFDKTFHLTEEFAALGMAGLAAAEAADGDQAARDAAAEKATADRAEELWAFFNEKIKDDPMTLGPRMRTQEGFADALFRTRFGRPRPREPEPAPDGQNN